MEQLNLIPSQWQQIYAMDNLFLAYQKAKKGKTTRDDVALFSLNLEKELSDLHHELRNNMYRPGGYRQFSIYERKPRIISVALFRDRVIHHSLMNILEPIIDKTFIAETFACRKGKGVHAAVDYYQQQCSHYQYVLKMDVQRYFPSVDHQRLKKQLRQLIFDQDVLNLLDDIIDSNSAKIGLPIGNLTSQVLANLYLDQLDKFIIKDKKVRYLRYVDDLFLLANDKQHLWAMHKEIVNLLAGLKLRLHSNLSQIFKTSEKVDVLGYKVVKNKRWLRNENGFRFRRKLMKFTQMYKVGKITMEDIQPNVHSWIGHAQHAETLGLRTKLFNNASFQREQI